MGENKINKNLYVSRDLSWLKFNERVMNQAHDKTIPLYERLNFLKIYSSNLDEFFMVRVGSLTHRNIFLPGYKDPKTGRTIKEELKKINQAVLEQQKIERKIYDDLIKDFSEAGIEKIDFRNLSKADELMTKKMFAEYKDYVSARIIDFDHPMPFLANCESYYCALISKGGKDKLGLVSLYRLPKFNCFDSEDGKHKVVFIDELILHYASALFNKYTVKDKCLIRITRNADVFLEDYEKSEKSDSKSGMKKMLSKRKRSMPVRLQIYGKPEEILVSKLKVQLGLSDKDIYIGRVPFNLAFDKVIQPSESQVYPVRKPVRNISLTKGQFFTYLEKKDILLSFPYQSIKPFIDLVYEAADDPTVESISITLYRLAASSRLAAALAYAADKGKDVLCLLELRARFDEQNNIDYSELLEDAGCSIIYGLPNMKVHSKLMVIKRRNADGSIGYITQVGTGNYNEVTSEHYTDISIITSNKEVGHDAEDVFKSLLLGEEPSDTDYIMMAPKGFKKKLLALLDTEKEKGSEGRVSIKCNGMNDIDVMEKLIECSKAGVKIELFIRGICCLKPGLPDATSNIIVKSIVGRYLEHSRIYVFGVGSDQRIFVGSGDLLNRNTERRVEAFIELTTSETKADVLEIMNAYRNDINNSWIMQPNGIYQKFPSAAGNDSFERLAEYFASRKVYMSSNKEKEREGFFRRLFRGR